MSPLRFVNIAASVRVVIPDELFKQHFPSPVSSLGQQMAQQVYDYVIENKLGYFPALDFIRQQVCIDDYLIDAYQQVADVALSLSEEAIYTSLRPVFSKVNIESMHLLSETLPTVRLTSQNKLPELAKHLTPNAIKFDLSVAIIQKHESTSGLEKAAREMLVRWLGGVFEQVEVTSSTQLDVE